MYVCASFMAPKTFSILRFLWIPPLFGVEMGNFSSFVGLNLINYKLIRLDEGFHYLKCLQRLPGEYFLSPLPLALNVHFFSLIKKICSFFHHLTVWPATFFWEKCIFFQKCSGANNVPQPYYFIISHLFLLIIVVIIVFNNSNFCYYSHCNHRCCHCCC